jgi:hypothetical protein
VNTKFNTLEPQHLGGKALTMRDETTRSGHSEPSNGSGVNTKQELYLEKNNRRSVRTKLEEKIYVINKIVLKTLKSEDECTNGRFLRH